MYPLNELNLMITLPMVKLNALYLLYVKWLRYYIGFTVRLNAVQMCLLYKTTFTCGQRSHLPARMIKCIRSSNLVQSEIFVYN